MATVCINGEHLRLDIAAELLAMIIIEKIGGCWSIILEKMKDFLLSIRPGCRKEYQGLTVSRDYPT